MSSKILTFGSLNIDYVYSVDHFVQKGETLASSALEIFSGGKGLNQSVALGRAGAEVFERFDKVRAGEKIGYCPSAVFYDEQPVSFAQSWRQRRR